MATKAPTFYKNKKQDGVLTFDNGTQAVRFVPSSDRDGNPSFEATIETVTNLQQTPASSAKAALRIVVQAPGASAVENHVFNFTAAENARKDQETVTDALRDAITLAKAKANESQSGSMAFAQTVNAGSKALESWYDDQRLKADMELQQSLLKKDPELRQRFEQSLREKPEAISNSQFAEQFWSARIYLLRAYAIDKSQQQGSYNVLAEVKPKNVDGSIKLNLSGEQIQLIFNQHPMVMRIYNECVPKLSEMDFWSRFFVSRLFKKLKGEKITDADATDAVLDKYLNMTDDDLKRNAASHANVPHFIDLEGNEQNHSQRQGNQPDRTMRDTAYGAPILRVLNNMSERMMANVTPSDNDLHAPIGMDEETFNELRLRDLQADAEEDRALLNMRSQVQLFKGSRGNEISREARLYGKDNPHKVLRFVCTQVDEPINLEEASDVQVHDTGDAIHHLSSLISRQRALLLSADVSTNIPASIMQSLLLTHNTTTEFLHYFWTLVFASATTNPKDLPSLLSTLSNSLTRIAAVADEAEKDRQREIADLRRKATEHEQRTGKRRRADERQVKSGGRKEVEQLMKPTIDAIAFAKERFQSMMQ